MPGKRKYKKKRKETKRRYRKRRSGYNQMTNISRTPIAKRALIKMRYVEDFSLDPNDITATVNAFQFRANDVYDPNYTGGGHQPHGFDQWMTFYQHFTVLGSKMTAKFMNSTDSQNVCWVGIDVHSTPGAVTNNSTLMRENGQGVWRQMTGKGKPTVLTKTFSGKKFFGVKNIIGEADYKGSSTLSPTEAAYYSVMAGNIQSNNPTEILVSVTIDYIVMLTEPVAIGQS